MLFTKLLLAHLLADFVLQPSRWVIHKNSRKIRSAWLYVHLLLHFGLSWLFLWDWQQWKMALGVALLHGLVDLGKIYLGPKFKRQGLVFFLDQGLHIAVLFVLAYYPNAILQLKSLLAGIDWPLVTAYVFVSYPAAIIMGELLRPYAGRIQLDHKSLPNAGSYIGMLERLFVLTFILLGRWEAIGLLITAKSVFRFNDLKESNNRKLTEYILIGTLLSFGLAIVAGLAYLKMT